MAVAHHPRIIDSLTSSALPGSQVQRRLDLLIPGDSAPERSGFVQQDQAFEKFIIEYAINRCGGNVSDSADYLGLPRRTLGDKIQKYKIERVNPKT